jgi:hypothetical protein
MAAENAALTIQLAHRFAEVMRESGMPAPDGCATLALAYGIWIEAQQQADAGHCIDMMEAGKQHALEAYQRLRAYRLIDNQLDAGI